MELRIDVLTGLVTVCAELCTDRPGHCVCWAMYWQAWSLCVLSYQETSIDVFKHYTLNRFRRKMSSWNIHQQFNCDVTYKCDFSSLTVTIQSCQLPSTP